MCVGDKRPVTSSLGEYVCIWAPIVKQTDFQIRMINWADLNQCILITFLEDLLLSRMVKSFHSCEMLMPISAYLERRKICFQSLTVFMKKYA